MFSLCLVLLLHLDGEKQQPQGQDRLGSWVVLSVKEVAFKEVPEPFCKKGDKVTFLKDRFVYNSQKGVEQEVKYTLNRSKTPWHIDLTYVDKKENGEVKVHHLFGVMNVTEGRLKLCITTWGDDRPESCTIQPGDRWRQSFEMERLAADKK